MRDDRSCKLASTHQVLLGSCLTAHASGASLSLGELPLRMHMCAMSLYLDVYCPVEPHQTPRRSFVGGMLHSPPHLPQPRASSAAPACILLMLPQASARATCAWLALSIGVYKCRHTRLPGEEWGARYAFFPPNVFSSLYVRTRSVQDAASDSLVELSYDLPKISSLLAAHSRSDLAQHVLAFVRRQSSRVSGK